MSQVAAYYPAVGTMPRSPSPTPSRPSSCSGCGHLPIAPPAAARTAAQPHVAPDARRDMPDSQESGASAASSTFSAPRLPSSSSNLSLATVAEAEATQADIAATAASPVPLPAPVAQGFKRKADEPRKGVGPEPDAPAARVPAHKRNRSMDTHSGTRIGELSAQLKTRLSYAMVKVQNGWEKQSLDELEEVHSQRGSPHSAPERGDGLAFESPYASHRRRRPSGVSDSSDHMIMSPASHPTRSYAITPPAYWRPGTINATANLISITNAHSLAPAPTFQPSTRRRRSSISHPPPPLLISTPRKHYSDLGVGPQTPATPRAGILRMPSQQAEKDAVDTLLFLSSPNNSQRYPAAGPAAPSPLRADAPQRKVMFDVFPPPQVPAPPHQHQRYGPYAADGAR